MTNDDRMPLLELYIKTKKVINSVTTHDQIEATINYLVLSVRRICQLTSLEMAIGFQTALFEDLWKHVEDHKLY